MRRRTLLLAAAALPWAAQAQVQRGRVLAFPRDHGAHLETRTEWWYATGWLGPNEAPRLGWQLTFFRSRTGLADANPSRFAARQLLFGHAAVTDLAAGRHHHAQRIARWSGRGDAASRAGSGDTELQLGDWSLHHDAGHYRARLPADGFSLDLELHTPLPPLLQGDAGFSRKGPLEQQASHYYSRPQLAVAGRVVLDGQTITLPGRGWLDHEWSEAYLATDAVGWDWLGMNLFDGSALTAFRLRRADGSVLWAGGSWLPAGGTAQAFAAEAVQFTPGRAWTSPASQARYPVQWQLATPAGHHSVRALLDAQELDSRGSTGAIYWEGLSELLDAQGRRIGLGYLEMTGYASRLLMR